MNDNKLLSAIDIPDTNDRYRLPADHSTYQIAGQLVHVLEDYILRLFPENTFRYTYTNTQSFTYGKKVKFRKAVMKERKPILALNPSVDYNPDESLTMYKGYVSSHDTGLRVNPEANDLILYAPAGDGTDRSTIKVYMKRTDLVIDCTCLLIFSTMGQAMSHKNYLKENSVDNMTNIEATIDIPFSDTLLEDVFRRSNLDYADNSQDAMKAKLEYLEKYSNMPIMYKMDESIGNYRYFYRVQYDVTIKLTPSAKFAAGTDGAAMRIEATLVGIEPQSYMVEEGVNNFGLPIEQGIFMQTFPVPIPDFWQPKYTVNKYQRVNGLYVEYTDGDTTLDLNILENIRTIYGDIIIPYLDYIKDKFDNNEISDYTAYVDALYYKDGIPNNETTWFYNPVTTVLTDSNGEVGHSYWVGIYLNKKEFMDWSKMYNNENLTNYIWSDLEIKEEL